MKWDSALVSRRPIPDEFELIARYLAPLAADEPGAYGLLDDAAILDVGPESRLVITVDAAIEGVHFLPEDSPDLIGRKLLRYNLSDLAAKGAEPFAYLLTMALRSDLDAGWIEGFVAGLAEDQTRFGVTLVGGDTTATPGPISLSITALGRIGRSAQMLRSGARPGDLIVVSGSIGDAALGLALLKGPSTSVSQEDTDYLVGRYRLPEPRVALGAQLLGMASAALDVSDGLVADLDHICAVSGVGAEIEAARVPLSPAARRLVGSDEAALGQVLTGGDDYELLFTVPHARAEALETIAQASAIPLTRIGTIVAGKGVRVVGPDGSAMTLDRGGYRHF
jgi:thiamine-monophosphate kinase